jgi:hypothetical protein
MHRFEHSCLHVLPNRPCVPDLMTTYRALIPYLDECGSIYLPGIGRDRSCVRLNPAASSIWRQIAAGDAVRVAPEATRSFLGFLIDRGAISALKE